jgi:superfamily II DNA or RNA helicase
VGRGLYALPDRPVSEHNALAEVARKHPQAEVMPRLIRETLTFPDDAGIQAVFRTLAEDDARTAVITAEIEHALDEGRKLLVLTERTDHLERLQSALERSKPAPFVLHGRMSRKQRADLVEQLDRLPADALRVLLATGRLIGEGLDHPPLDTLVLAMPVSWKGTLQQYAGRLHRDHATKSAVRIIDFVDTDHPALLRMWEKRRRGYLAMDYRVAEPRDCDRT